MWAEMLRPIIRRFVATFDGEHDASFWSHVAYRNDQVCGQDDLSGWITAFCVWSNKGVWGGGSLPGDIPSKPECSPIAPVSPIAPNQRASAAPSAQSKSLEDSSNSAAEASGPGSARDTSAPSDGGSVMTKGRYLAFAFKLNSDAGTDISIPHRPARLQQPGVHTRRRPVLRGTGARHPAWVLRGRCDRQ